MSGYAGANPTYVNNETVLVFHYGLFMMKRSVILSRFKTLLRHFEGFSMHRYESDIVAWANEQAALLRAGQFNMLDLEHIADEIEDVGKSERRELRSRMAVLLAHLLKWQYQEGFRSKSWQRTIKEQRRGIAGCLKETPSLKTDLTQPDWWEWVWSDAVSLAVKETGLDCFPESCPWDIEQVMNSEFWPE